MFNAGQILVNKKAKTLVVLVMDSEGNGKIIGSSNKSRIGRHTKCSDPKFYDLHENPEQYTKERILLINERGKKHIIKKYL